MGGYLNNMNLPSFLPAFAGGFLHHLTAAKWGPSGLRESVWSSHNRSACNWSSFQPFQFYPKDVQVTGKASADSAVPQDLSNKQTERRSTIAYRRGSDFARVNRGNDRSVGWLILFDAGVMREVVQDGRHASHILLQRTRPHLLSGSPSPAARVVHDVVEQARP